MAFSGHHEFGVCALVGTYSYYVNVEKHIKNDGEEYTLNWLFENNKRAAVCESWLSTVGSWKGLTKHNFLQIFAKQEGKRLGETKPLRGNHFSVRRCQKKTDWESSSPTLLSRSEDR